MNPNLAKEESTHFSFLFVFLTLITLFWWILAFYPLSQTSPEWLSVIKTVCFGRMKNGLPENYGWMLLIGAPLLMYAALFLIWWEEFKIFARSLRIRRGRKGGIALLLIFVMTTGAWVYAQISKTKKIAAGFEKSLDDFPATYPRTDRPAPDFRLLNQQGKSLTLQQFRGRPVYLTFAFAHCATMCPTLVRNVLHAARQGKELNPALLIVSLDPWRDTPSALPTRAKDWGLEGDEFFLSGTVDEVNQVIDSYNIPRTRDPRTGDLIHPGLVYVIDPQGRIAYTLNSPSSSALTEAVRRVTAKNPGSSHHSLTSPSNSPAHSG